MVRRTLLVFALSLALAPTASAAINLSIRGDVSRFHNLTGQVSDGQQKFVQWNTGINYPGNFPNILATFGPTPILALQVSQAAYGKTEVITPRGIALGHGDRFLRSLNVALHDYAQPVYIRPLAEMNGHWNPYCAYNANGTRRDAAHSQKYYRLAFRRMYLFMHGGTAAWINSKLKAWGLPGIKRNLWTNSTTNVRVIWNPQGFGSPNVSGNMPKAYWPGSRYVDVVGDDLYDIHYKAEWAAADKLYDDFAGKPFAFPEWGLWGIDDPAFVRHMRRFVDNHSRVEMLAFFASKKGNIFDLGSKPASRTAYKNYIVPLG